MSLANMQSHIQTIYTWDQNGRITGSNQFSGGVIPRFHLGLTDEGSHWVFRDDVSAEVISDIERLARAEPALTVRDSLPRYHAEYQDILAREGGVESVWHGPAYTFPSVDTVDDPRVVPIDESNQSLLEKYMDDWLIDVPHRRPFLAVVEDGAAVAVCASVRITEEAHEAGVETVPSYRKRGFASLVVRAWAAAVAQMNARPLYSTSWENHGSLSVSRSLGLEFIGTDFHIR